VACRNEIAADEFRTRKKKKEKVINFSKSILFVSGGLLFCSTALANVARAQENTLSHDHDKAHCDLIARGNKAMGFEAAKTTHHFRLSSEGGVIEVSANDAADTASRDEIQQHLKHIARKFKEGDFDIPMFVHNQVPPGAPAMKRFKDAITYEYAATEHGARVVISTTNPDALQAIHNFLRFQIQEHPTGDKQ
jgi:hypothetical protein